MKEKELKREEVFCWCEEVTKREIIEAIKLEVKTVYGMKRITGAGMGLCQSRTCHQLVEQLITKETGLKLSELPPPSKRPPVKPIKIGVITGGKEYNE